MMASEEDANKFAKGLLSFYEPDLKRVQSHLQDLTTKQAAILKDIEAENQKFTSMRAYELNGMFTTVADYTVRLLKLKREMNTLSERSTKLKARALRLQEWKQQEALTSAQKRESELRREQNLVSTSSATTLVPSTSKSTPT